MPWRVPLLIALALAPEVAEARESPIGGAVIACGYDRRAGRFEIAPAAGISAGDPLVRHYQGTLGLHYWITNTISIGTETPLYRSEPLPALHEIPIQYRRHTSAPRLDFGWNANAQLAIGDGKLALFGDVWGFDLVTTLGAGVTQIGDSAPPSPMTRIPPATIVVDDSLAFTVNAGLAARFFACDSASISAGVRVLALHDPAVEEWTPVLLFQVGVSGYLGPMRRRCRVITGD